MKRQAPPLVRVPWHWPCELTDLILRATLPPILAYCCDCHWLAVLTQLSRHWHATVEDEMKPRYTYIDYELAWLMPLSQRRKLLGIREVGLVQLRFPWRTCFESLDCHGCGLACTDRSYPYGTEALARRRERHNSDVFYRQTYTVHIPPCHYETHYIGEKDLYLPGTKILVPASHCVMVDEAYTYGSAREWAHHKVGYVIHRVEEVEGGRRYTSLRTYYCAWRDYMFEGVEIKMPHRPIDTPVEDETAYCNGRK